MGVDNNTDRCQLPIGIQDFRTIREANFYYVDKTSLIHQLVREGRFYFLSRPRRFGKSLLVSTLKSLFEGNKSLFEGLAIHDLWDWSINHPVVWLSFGGKYSEPDDIENSVCNQLRIIASNAGIPPLTCVGNDGSEMLRELLNSLHKETSNSVVVLIDEYDKPILDVLETPSLAKENRDYLRGFYGIIKDCAEHIRFTLITGVTMFSKVSLFSGLNNLEDISLYPRFATICGYTDADLDEVFSPELPELDRSEIRRWYNGYSWRGDTKVYNPFDILLLFRTHEFKPYWFETGSPTFLFQMLVEKKVNSIDLGNRIVAETLTSTFDVGDIGIDALLFQTGYLTIVAESWNGVETQYTLDYPNFEVSVSLNRSLLEFVTSRQQDATTQGIALAGLLAENDFNGFGKQLRAYLSGIPHQWYDVSNVERFEAHYASMLYMAFRSIGVDLRVEDASSHGRSDMTLFIEKQVFMLEFKMADGDGDTDKIMAKAMKQIRECGYGRKYQDRGEPVHLVGLVFSRSERNLLGIKAERM